MKRRLIANLLIITTMLIGTQISANAASTTVSLPKGLWTTVSTTRTGNYSYGEARCLSVYPFNGGTDNYHKIQAKITSSSNSAISDVVVLDERNTTNTKLYIKEGNLGIKNIKFGFKGNDPELSAKASVSYNGK